MKYPFNKTVLFLLTSILFLSFIAATDDPKDRLNVKGPLTFGNKSFKIAWTSHPEENYYIQEYLPDGEKLDGFNQMLTIYLQVSDSAVNDAVTQKIEELTKRKKTGGESAPACLCLNGTVMFSYTAKIMNMEDVTQVMNISKQKFKKMFNKN